MNDKTTTAGIEEVAATQELSWLTNGARFLAKWFAISNASTADDAVAQAL